MVNNAQKVPLYRSINQAAQNRVLDALQLAGKELPCSVVSTNGWIVTVAFEIDAAPFTLPHVTVPVASSVYDYIPLQPGDLGVVFSADAYLGGVSGLGGGTATLRLMANLSALVFVPIGNANFAPPDDPNKRVIQGPNGFVLQDVGKNCTIVGDEDDLTLTAKTTLTLQVGANSIVISASGIALNGPVTAVNGLAVTGAATATGEITAGLGGVDSVTLQHHKHGTGAAAAGTSVPTAGT